MSSLNRDIEHQGFEIDGGWFHPSPQGFLFTGERSLDLRVVLDKILDAAGVKAFRLRTFM